MAQNSWIHPWNNVHCHALLKSMRCTLFSTSLNMLKSSHVQTFSHCNNIVSIANIYKETAAINQTLTAACRTTLTHSWCPPNSLPAVVLNVATILCNQLRQKHLYCRYCRLSVRYTAWRCMQAVSRNYFIDYYCSNDALSLILQLNLPVCARHRYHTLWQTSFRRL